MVNTIKKMKKKKGFTLIELIIVLAIMAVLVAIAVPSFNQLKENSKVKADIKSCDSIDKSVTTLVIDETIKTLPSSCDVNPATGALSTVSGFSAAGEQTAITNVVRGSKAPQASGQGNYHIDINASGEVTVTTIP